MASAQGIFGEALVAFNQRDLIEAERLFRSVLELDKRNVAALNLLTVVLMSVGRFREAEEFIARAVKLNQNSDVSFYNYGLISKQINKPHQALDQFDKALALNGNVPEAWNSRGTVYNDLKNYSAALADFERAIELNKSYAEAYANKGKALTELGRYDDALSAYAEALTIKPDLAEAWLGRGNACYRTKQYDLALEAYNKASTLNPNLAGVWLGRGNVFTDLKRYSEATAAYGQSLKLDPSLSKAWLGIGNVNADLRRSDDAFAAYDKALSLSPELAEAWLGRGNVLTELRRHNEAFAAYDKALQIDAALAGAWTGRGNLFGDLGRHDEALAAFDKALALCPELPGALLGRGVVFTALKRRAEAFAAFDKALTLDPDLAGAWFGRGTVFASLHCHDEALAAYNKALELDPRLPGAWLGRGNEYASFRRFDESIAAYRKALEIKPVLAEAWSGLGNVFTQIKRYDEAVAAYDQAYNLKPDLPWLEGYRLHARMFRCDWGNYEKYCASLIHSLHIKRCSVTPFVMLAVSESPQEQFECANIYISEICSGSALPGMQEEIYRNEKIRVGYLSSDFKTHPVAYLMAGVFEAHDRQKFETFAISIGPDDRSAMRDRVIRAFDTFVDANRMSEREVAEKIRELRIDILVDLNGHTDGSRTCILAHRPAPIQVNYLGYPGTIGASFIDYIIADQTVAPLNHQEFYKEKIVHLPICFLPHDGAGRQVSEGSLKRSDFDLPNDGFVFCCFNNSYKLNPNTFRSWMNILRQTHGSVLWLSDTNADAKSNLKNEALASGVNPERLVFAKILGSASDHLARHRLADLFLDTLPYNAHTTASDALWVGLPVLTQLGEAFAGRVAGSLLRTIDMPELIVHSREEYERLAIELAQNPNNVAAIKQKLARNRSATPLFNTTFFTRQLERAYTAMYQRYQTGLPPDHIQVGQIEAAR